MMVRGMDFRASECFVVLAEELHFRRAAERLNMTQPSLSARVKALEEEVGAVLLATPMFAAPEDRAPKSL
jgi:DNA-binding transcriptional LysR family regulator